MDAPFQVGDSFEADFSFTEENIRAIATLLGDTNPVHHEPAPEFGALIASGPHIAGVVMAFEARHLTERVRSLGRTWSIRFRAPILAGETLHMVWQITAIEPHRRGAMLRLEGAGTVERGGEGVVAVTTESTPVILAGTPER